MGGNLLLLSQQQLKCYYSVKLTKLHLAISMAQLAAGYFFIYNGIIPPCSGQILQSDKNVSFSQQCETIFLHFLMTPYLEGLRGQNIEV